MGTLVAEEPSATVGHPTFNSPHASPIAMSGGHVFVANTPADTVDVIDAWPRCFIKSFNALSLSAYRAGTPTDLPVSGDPYGQSPSRRDRYAEPSVIVQRVAERHRSDPIRLDGT